MQALTNTEANPADPEHPFPGDPSSTRPQREAGYTDYPGLDGREYVPFILRDLFFDFIPALQGSTKDGWYTFANFTPIFFNMRHVPSCCCVRLDVIRLDRVSSCVSRASSAAILPASYAQLVVIPAVSLSMVARAHFFLTCPLFSRLRSSWVLFGVNALIHVSTTYPDAGGYQDVVS